MSIYGLYILIVVIALIITIIIVEEWIRFICKKISAKKHSISLSIGDYIRERYAFIHINVSLLITTILISFIMLLSYNSVIRSWVGYFDIYTAPSGTYCLYAEANGKMCLAQISTQEYEVPNRDGYETMRALILEKIVLSENEIFYFDDEVFVDEETFATDSDEREWSVKVINQRGKSNVIKETEQDAIQKTELFIILITYLPTIFVVLKNSKSFNLQVDI